MLYMHSDLGHTKTAADPRSGVFQTFTYWVAHPVHIRRDAEDRTDSSTDVQ